MRMILLAASSVLALAACTPATPAATDGAASDAAKPADAAHNMAGMDDSMKSSDTADDTNTAETQEGYTFHTYPAKIETVHLPTAAGNVWTATSSDTALVEVGEAKDETMAGGAMHHVVKLTATKAGNATVKFERRASANASDPVTETRTINVMVH